MDGPAIRATIKAEIRRTWRERCSLDRAHLSRETGLTTRALELAISQSAVEMLTDRELDERYLRRGR